MALNVFELFGKIVIDSSGAKSGLDSAVGNAKKAESKLAATFKKIGTAVAAAFSVKAVVDFGKQCTQAYATIAAEESAFAQIMGDYAGVAQQKLDAVSKQTGVVSTRLTASMTSMTAKFKGLGYSVEDATTLAADGLLIASDAAAFWDMSLEDSMSHLNSFINGSYEGGEAIGLFANDTQMAAYAIEQGIVADAKAWAALDEAQRQATRLEYAKNMMDMSGATGQAAKESKAYANVMANLKEHWRQFQGIIGKPILEKIVLPAMQKLNEFMPKLNKAVQEGIVWLDNGFSKIKSYFADVSAGKVKFGIDLPDWATLKKNISDGWNNTVWPAIQSFFKVAFGIDLPNWATIKQNISDGWDKTVWPEIQNFFKVAFGVDLPDWETLKQNISDGWNNTVWPAIQGFFTQVFGITLPSWEQLKTKISDGWNKTVWPAIQGFFKNPMEVILPAWETLKANITNGWSNTVLPAIQGFFKNPFEVSLPSWEEIKTSITDGWNGTVWPAIQNFFSASFGIGMPSWEELKTNIKTGWNDVVWPAIKDFFKAAFEIAVPAWETLKTNIKTGWNDTVWPGIKDFFKTAFEIALPVWETLKTAIANGWNNIVVPALSGLFEAVFEVKTEDADGTEVGKKIREWWDKAVAVIGDIFKAIFSVGPEDEDGATTGQKIKDWWDSVVKFIGNIFRGFFGIDPEDEEDTGNRIITWFEEVLKFVGDIFAVTFDLLFGGEADEANNIKTWWNNILTSIGNLFSKTFELLLPDVSGMIQKIKNWWASVKNGLSLSATATVNTIVETVQQHTAYQGGYGTAGAGTSVAAPFNAFTSFFGDDVPGFATGLDYVPYDNYLARLHKGEAVLTSSEADVWRGGGTGRVESALAQMAETLRVIAQNTGAEKQVVLETGALVGQLAPGIDARLGMYSNRKGRRN